VSWVVVGGAGFIGGAACRRLHAAGETVVAIDSFPTPTAWESTRADLLVDRILLPAGRVVLAHGSSNPRLHRPWTLVMDNALATARLAPQLTGRQVTLISTIEVYGSAPGPLTEDSAPTLPVDEAVVSDWVESALGVADGAALPHRVFGLCRRLEQCDPSGRWVYALSKLAQEMIVRAHVPEERLTVLRLANVVGPGQFRFLGRVVEAMLDGRPCRVTDTLRSFVSVEEVARVAHTVTAPGTYNVSSGSAMLPDVVALAADELGVEAIVELTRRPQEDSCGHVDATRLTAEAGPLEDLSDALRRATRQLADDPEPMFRPALPVVIPPRPEDPATVADRMASAHWSGELRGGRWTAALDDALREQLALDETRRLVLTNSGTNALRLAVSAVARPTREAPLALCPAFTFHATAEVLAQLGWAVRLVDVDPASWTLAPGAVESALLEGGVGVVVTVDALGNPSPYAQLVAVCDAGKVPLVADSAPSLGARYGRAPVGSQAATHAYSFSFAKVVSGGGSGGAVVLPAGAELRDRENWMRSAPIGEPSAVVALDGVEVLEVLIARRNAVAEVYHDAFAGAGDLVPQAVSPGNTHSWVHWVALVDDAIGRDRLAALLSAEGVQTKPYYEPLSPAFGGEKLRVTAELHRRALALPMSSELTREDAERVVAAVRRSIRRLARPVHRTPVAAHEPDRLAVS
jgi:dTDP-4-amino-4,6-dideoxygalactose transaminase/nucleoside-diphosphate-sugar epimerase